MRNQLLLWFILGAFVLTTLNSVHDVLAHEEYIRLRKQHGHGVDHIQQMEQPLSGIQIHKTVLALTKSASIHVAGSNLLGSKVTFSCFSLLVHLSIILLSIPFYVSSFSFLFVPRKTLSFLI